MLCISFKLLAIPLFINYQFSVDQANLFLSVILSEYVEYWCYE